MTEGPATVASLKADGFKTVMAWCDDLECGHSAAIPLEDWPDETAVPDIAVKLRCKKCGSKRIKTILNMEEHYQLHQEKFGF